MGRNGSEAIPMPGTGEIKQSLARPESVSSVGSSVLGPNSRQGKGSDKTFDEEEEDEMMQLPDRVPYVEHLESKHEFQTDTPEESALSQWYFAKQDELVGENENSGLEALREGLIATPPPEQDPTTDYRT